jgi:hypothetical protein
MRRVAAGASAVLCLFACAVGLACGEAISIADQGATNACAPLADPKTPVSFEGLTPDGHYVVVAGSGSAARVFYGIAAHLAEGTIDTMQSSCGYEIDFSVEGRSYVATFSPDSVHCALASKVVSGDPGGPMAQMALTVVTFAGAPVDTADGGAGDAGAIAASPGSLMFYCL